MTEKKQKTSLCALLKKDLRTESGLKITYKVIARPEALAVFLFRLSSRLYNKGKIGWFFSMMFWRLNIIFNACDIQPVANIGPGFSIAHPMAIVIGPITAGENFTVYHSVTLARKHDGDQEAVRPTFGNNVVIYSGACVFGAVKVGDNVSIAANSVVLKDVEANTIVGGIPAKVIKNNNQPTPEQKAT